MVGSIMTSYSPFLPPNDPRLRQSTPSVATDIIASPAFQAQLEELYAIARQRQSAQVGRILVGLAAPQVGISQRILLVDVASDGHGGTGQLVELINPEITEHSAETTQWYEGCYSTGPICGIVDRYRDITVRTYDRKANQHTYEFHGYNARIFQHEIDHLDGKVFIDHITNPDRLHLVSDDEFVTYRDQEQWRHWPHKCTFAQWEALKNQPELQL